MDIYSPSKAIYHVDKIKSLQEGKPISPTLLQVDLESYCNDNCLFCSYRKENGYNTAMLDLIIPKEKRGLVVLNENKPIGRPSANSSLSSEWSIQLPEMMKEAHIPAIELTGGGEPTIWKYFDLLLDNLIFYKIEIGLVTNGSNLSDSRILKLAKYGTWVRFSMDASDSEMHQKIHRTPNQDFDRRIENIKSLVIAKKSANSQLTIGISFIITPQNYTDITNSANLYKSLGVDNIRFSWMYDKEGHAGLNDVQITSAKQHLSELKKSMDSDDFKILYSSDRIDSFSLPNDDFDTCYMQRFVWALGADYKIYPCCIMKYVSGFELGDIRKNTLLELVEKSHEKMNLLNVQACNPCWLRDRNKSISDAVKRPQHHNFV